MGRLSLYVSDCFAYCVGLFSYAIGAVSLHEWMGFLLCMVLFPYMNGFVSCIVRVPFLTSFLFR